VMKFIVHRQHIVLPDMNINTIHSSSRLSVVWLVFWMLSIGHFWD